MVQFNLPTELEVKALVDYVSERLGVRFLYDEKIANKKLNIRAPGEVPVESLPGLLQSALRMKGLMLIQTDRPDFFKIVESSRLVEGARPLAPDEPLDGRFSDEAVTQVFVVKHLSPARLNEIVRPILTPQAGTSIPLEGQKILIVTDYVSTVQRLARLIEQVDVPTSDTVIEFIPVKHLEASTLVDRVQVLLAPAARGVTPVAGETQSPLNVSSDERTNQLIVVGRTGEIDRVRSIVAKLDVSIGALTEIYRLKSLAPEKLDRLARGLVPVAEQKRRYQSVVDADERVLVVTADADLHRAIRDLVTRLDVAANAEERSRIRYYRLKYITADKALETIKGVVSGERPAPREFQEARPDGRFRMFEGERLPGPNQPQTRPRRDLLESPAVNPPPDAAPLGGPGARSPENAVLASTEQLGDAELLAKGAHVTADVPSNTLIIVADPPIQRVYEDLIKFLDKPRPQVLIEAKIVVLDTTDNFELGIEVSGGDRVGAQRLFGFSSFGLSTPNAVNGSLALIPGVGFNGTLVDPDIADVVLRAFSQHRRAKVISAPRVLVNDNATGLLTSVSEIPFTSVNASQTVATTSFAGFAEAGTTIECTPHISETDQLQLEYRVTLNEFTGTGSAGVPPPRQTNEIESVVTIPDGHTLIVGGLHRTSHVQERDGLPFIEKIPVLKYAFSDTKEDVAENSLFIFLRPVILRDDKFRDLKYHSEADVKRADVPGAYPRSEPILIK
ncbi:secretin N-terminal domain-containing protein [Caulifigura coniformis]|nr:secretin N-terminal domain-containing protein [Caulifigura coniformis]